MEKTDLSLVDQKMAESTSSLDEASNPAQDVSGTQSIYIDPAAEKAVLRKFDKFLLPQAFLFILLNYLDRSNLGKS